MDASSLSPHRPNLALQALRDGRLVRLYVAGNFATPRHVDLVCRSGHFDALWFDLEHFDLPVPELATLAMVARAYPVTTIARLKATDYQAVMRVLETGVGGIMCSMVESADEAREIVSWAKFHNANPVSGEVTGRRGWNGGNIDGGYGTVPAAEYIRQQNTQTMVICQVEHDAALAQAGAIAAVPGVDGIFFGPGDYAASLGLPGQIAHPRVHAAMERVNAAVRAAGKWWGTVAVGAENFAKARALGALLVCPGGDLKVMHLGLAELAKTFAGEKGAAAGANGTAVSPTPARPAGGAYA